MKFAAETHLVVLSHDCDVCHDDLAAEPWIEVMPIHRGGDTPKGEFTLLKNPRELHFWATVGSDSGNWIAFARERLTIPRRVLLDDNPRSSVSTKPPGLLASWFGRRYIREAFPDEFNARRYPVRDKVTKALSKGGQCLSGVYLAGAESELEGGIDYRILIRGSMLAEDYETPERRHEAQEALDMLAGHLDDCDGIQVLDADLVSESDLTLAEFRVLKRLDEFDPITLRRSGSTPPTR